MKAIHSRIKVTYNFENKVNQKVNLGRRPSLPGFRYLKGLLFKKLLPELKKKKKNVNW